MVFGAVTEWLIPISVGLLAGILISSRKRHDYSQLIYLESEEFRLNMRKGQLLDLRKKEEFESKKINGSRNFPNRSLFAELHKLRKDQAVFIYDNSGSNPVKNVGKKLIKKGFKPVYILKGGLESWPFNIKE